MASIFVPSALSPTLLFFFNHDGVLFLPASEVPCCEVVSMARAELKENPRANNAVRSFASVSLTDAEKGCHKLFKKLGLCAPVQVEYLTQEGLKHIPYVKFSSWVQCLLDSNRLWRQVVGVSSWEKMKRVLREFWRRFQLLYPNHELFSLDIDLETTIPFFSHSDEGRTYKSKPIYILSVHGALGRGTTAYIRKQKHLVNLDRLQMGLNYVGSTWSNHFVFTTIVRQLMNDRVEALDALVEVFASDCQMLIEEGITSFDGTKHVRLLHLATKGDLPALSKLGGFTRSYTHVPRASASKKGSVGICFYCLAGRECDDPDGADIPFEDFLLEPKWLDTMFTLDPWESEPGILRGLPIDQTRKAQFFETDIWHNMHLGCLKHYIGSSFVSIIERLVGGPLDGSVDAKFAWLTADFKSWARALRISPFIAEVSRSTMGFPQGSACPLGQWSKGVVSTNFMQYLEYFCERHVVGKTADQVLLSIAFQLISDKVFALVVFITLVYLLISTLHFTPI